MIFHQAFMGALLVTKNGELELSNGQTPEYVFSKLPTTLLKSIFWMGCLIDKPRHSF
jgi:hypothetical protein